MYWNHFFLPAEYFHCRLSNHQSLVDCVESSFSAQNNTCNSTNRSSSCHKWCLWFFHCDNRTQNVLFSPRFRYCWCVLLIDTKTHLERRNFMTFFQFFFFSLFCRRFYSTHSSFSCFTFNTHAERTYTHRHSQTHRRAPVGLSNVSVVLCLLNVIIGCAFILFNDDDMRANSPIRCVSLRTF